MGVCTPLNPSVFLSPHIRLQHSNRTLVSEIEIPSVSVVTDKVVCRDEMLEDGGRCLGRCAVLPTPHGVGLGPSTVQKRTTPGRLRGQRPRGSTAHHWVGGSISGSSCLHVKVSLGKTVNPLWPTIGKGEYLVTPGMAAWLGLCPQLVSQRGNERPW